MTTKDKKEKKLILQTEDGTEIDLKEIMNEEMTASMKDLGFPVDDGGRFSMKQLPIELKDEVQKKRERSEVSANYVKSVVLKPEEYKKFGVKETSGIDTEDISFGYGVPTELADAILEKRDKHSVLRGRAFSFNMQGKFQLPIEGVGVTGYWVEENAEVTDSEPTLVKKALDDNYLAGRVLIPYKLLDTAAYNIEAFVSRLIGRKLAEQEETAFVGGDGTGKPRGIRQESVGEVERTADPLYQDLKKLYFKLPRRYRDDAIFMTSPGGMYKITGMVDKDERPIFQPGEPLDALWRKPLLESEDIPENLGEGNDTEVWFGDPFYYWIKDGAMRMESDKIIRNLQVELVTSMAVDGTMVLTDAWKKMTGLDTDPTS